MINIRVNNSEVIASLRQLSQRTDDLSPALEDVAMELTERIRQQFKKSESPYGDKWAPLSAVTQAKNKGRRSGGQPLLDTGRLRNSISGVDLGPRSVTIRATNVEYAPTHQFGAKQGAFGRSKRNGPIPWGNVPARPYMPIRGGAAILPQPWAEAASDIIQEYVRGEL